jgi:hypothetical protein
LVHSKDSRVRREEEEKERELVWRLLPGGAVGEG